MTTTLATEQVTETSSVELVIGGMTCASCAARIEKKLNKLDSVSATVHYATEKAKVTYAGTVSVQDLIATIEATGSEPNNDRLTRSSQRIQPSSGRWRAGSSTQRADALRQALSTG